MYFASGTAHVHVGSLEGEAQSGAIVFIPRNTWVSVANVGKTSIALLFAFNAPGFDRYLRCISVPKGKPRPPMSLEAWERCEQLGDVEYKQMPPK